MTCRTGLGGTAVIEAYGSPLSGGVAAIAIRLGADVAGGQAAGAHGVVAGRAFLRRTLEFAVAVTALAADAGVSTCQREAGPEMVEGSGLGLALDGSRHRRGKQHREQQPQPGQTSSDQQTFPTMPSVAARVGAMRSDLWLLAGKPKHRDKKKGIRTATGCRPDESAHPEFARLVRLRSGSRGDGSAICIDQDFAETAGHMAPRAILAKAAAMGIVALVAIDALATLPGRITRAGVAGRADQPFVPSGQGKAGRLVVIERPGLPTGVVVACLARRGRAQRAGVVRVLMAGGAGGALGGKALVGMAGGTGQAGVLAQQGKAGKIVIEAHLPGPAIGIVAARAIGAQPSGVGIVLGMARSAIG